MAELLAHVLALRRRRSARARRSSTALHGRAGGPFNYREGKALRDARAGRARGHRPRRLLRLLATRESDLPMLRAVGHPVAVNPDTELARVAREEGWEVLRFERSAGG